MRLTGRNWPGVAALLTAVAAVALLAGAVAAQNQSYTTSAFAGLKVNGGTATLTKMGSVRVLAVSDDFKVPDTPAPHWQVVDSKGNVYLLQRLDIKDNKFNRSIQLPAYISDVAKVQIWCAWAETLLGEASFAKPVK